MDLHRYFRLQKHVRNAPDTDQLGRDLRRKGASVNGMVGQVEERTVAIS